MKRIISILLVGIMTLTFFVGCNSKDTNKPTDNNEEVNLKDIITSVSKELGEHYLPDRQMTMEEAEALFDISKDQVEEMIIEAPTISVHVDMFAAIKAKEDQADAVEEKMIAFMEMMQANTMQYPMNEAKVEASRVVRHGNYIFYILLGKFDNRDNATPEERLEFAKSEVDRVEAVINKFFE